MSKLNRHEVTLTETEAADVICRAEKIYQNSGASEVLEFPIVLLDGTKLTAQEALEYARNI